MGHSLPLEDVFLFENFVVKGWLAIDDRHRGEDDNGEDVRNCLMQQNLGFLFHAICGRAVQVGLQFPDQNGFGVWGFMTKITRRWILQKK